MALITCPECGTTISEFAESCPTCGCPARMWSEEGAEGNATAAHGDGGAGSTAEPLHLGQHFQLGIWNGEALKWRVVDIIGGDVYALCEQGIECRPFNEKQWQGNDWETSSLAGWLNGAFRATAFPAAVQPQIHEVTCLSGEEAARLFATDEERACMPSATAARQGAYLSEASGTCCWWLRTPGDDELDALYVDMYGKINVYGCSIEDRGVTVRPALRVSR